MASARPKPAWGWVVHGAADDAEPAGELRVHHGGDGQGPVAVGAKVPLEPRSVDPQALDPRGLDAGCVVAWSSQK